jgi:hypothetical protein
VQAESALDQMDWIEKITGVIASLLSSQAPERVISKNNLMMWPIIFIVVLMIEGSTI